MTRFIVLRQASISLLKPSFVPVSRSFPRLFNMKSEQEWRAILSPQQFKVLRENGTEAPHTGEYVKVPQNKNATYKCVGCNNPLYEASTQFEAHCGWPAFYTAIPGAITTKVDRSFGMEREEMRCAKCDGHLGHIFKGEGYDTPTDARHCVNSICLKLEEN
jgi:peptide-methionine (R)-S-oxide reductase